MQAKLNMMDNILPHKVKTNNSSFLIEKSEERVRRQDEGTGRQALIDDTKRALMMATCPAELEMHRVINPGRNDTHPKIKPVIRPGIRRANAAQVRSGGDQRDVASAEDEHDGDWKETYAVENPRG